MSTKPPEAGGDATPDGWDVVFDTYQPGRERDRESQLALGNGHLLARAVAPEAVGDRGCAGPHYPGLYVAGGYDHGPREVRGQTVALAALVNLPNPFGLSFRPVGRGWRGDWYSMDAVALLHHGARLDLRHGVLHRRLRLRDATGRQTELHETRVVAAGHASLALLRWRLRPLDWSGEIEIRSCIDAGVGNRMVELDRAYEQVARLREIAARPIGNDRALMSARFVEPRRWVAVATRVEIGRDGAATVGVQDEDADDATCDPRVHVRVHCAPIDPRGLEIRKWIAVELAAPGEDAADRAAVETRALRTLAAAPDVDALLGAQAQAWAARWDHVGLEAAPEAVQRALRFNAFHLMQTVCRAHDRPEPPCGLPARGWQEMYGGQIFWDDLLAMPFLAMRFPQEARRLVAYRHAHLPAACERARRAGLRGAWFPWRDADRGQEETPPCQLNPLSGRWIHDHTEHQLHVHGAIAYGVWQTWLATGDDAFLAGEGGALLVELARFWCTRSQLDASTRRFRLRGVVGPDEFHPAYPGADAPGIDDNAYTNVIAAWTLRRAADLRGLLAPAAWRALSQARDVAPDEPAQWEAVAGAMFVPFLTDGVLAQFDGFDRLLPFPQTIVEAHPDTRADWLLEARGATVQSYQVVKQPDVLMLLHLFPGEELEAELRRMGYRFDADPMRRTLDHYLARTTHDSGLSAAICAGALSAVDAEASWRFYERALHTDLRADAHCREGLHLGAMTGTLDVLLRHYLGVRLRPDGLRLDPRAPRALERAGLRLTVRGCDLHVALQGEAVVLRASERNAGALTVHLGDGRARALGPGAAIEVAARLAPIR